MEGVKTVVRCVTIPVAVPLGSDPAGNPWTWQTFNAALLPAFRLSTDLANWAVHTLFRRDTPGEAKAPAAVKSRGVGNQAGCYLYGEAVAGFPDWSGRVAGAAASAQCVFQAVHKKYLQDRFAIMCRHESGLLTYRFPYPFPVHNATWKTGYASGDFPTVSVAIPGVGRVELRLKRDGGFRRQLAMFRQLHDGTAKRGEAALYRDRKGVLLLKMVGHFPRVERAGDDNVCFLHTDPNALLVAEINGRSVTVTNGDHLRRAHAVIREVNDRHRRFLQRAGEDKKREVRMDRKQRANLNAKVEDRCGKQRARLDTAVKQIAAQVARFLQRQRVGLVAYDDGVKTFLPDGFQWHALKTRLTQLFVGEMGGEWIDGSGMVSGRTTQEKVEWLARARATAVAGKRAVASAKRKGPHPAVTPATSTGSPSRLPKTRRKSARA